MRSRRNTAILAGLIAVLLVLVAFRTGAPSGGVKSPEDVANKYQARPVSVIAVANGPSDLFGCLKFCPPAGLFEDESGSAIVIYNDPNQGSQSPSSFSWDLVGEYGGRWYSVGGGSGDGSGLSSDVPPLISFITMPVPQSTITFRYGVRPGYVMTMGKLLSPKVARFDVRYDTGQIVHRRTVVSKDGKTSAFAMFTRARAVCQVQLFDSNGTLLQQINASTDPMLAMEIQRNAPGACQT